MFKNIDLIETPMLKDVSCITLSMVITGKEHIEKTKKDLNSYVKEMLTIDCHGCFNIDNCTDASESVSKCDKFEPAHI